MPSQCHQITSNKIPSQQSISLRQIEPIPCLSCFALIFCPIGKDDKKPAEAGLAEVFRKSKYLCYIGTMNQVAQSLKAIGIIAERLYLLV